MSPSKLRLSVVYIHMSAPALAPPMHFAMVAPGVYRSGYPTRHNLAFLHNLGLRTIVNLEPTPHAADLLSWISEHDIKVVEADVAACMEPFVVASEEEIARVLRILLDASNHPVLVHSLRGQARVGVVIGCLRRLQNWSLTATFDEYRRFAGITANLLDLQCIELFDIHAVASDHVADRLSQPGSATSTNPPPGTGTTEVPSERA